MSFQLVVRMRVLTSTHVRYAINLSPTHYQSVARTVMLLLVRAAVFVALWSCYGWRTGGLRSTRLVFSIPPRSRECFYERTGREDSQLHVEVQVLKGGSLDVGLSIYSPEENLKLTTTVRRDGASVELSLSGDNEVCKICLDNSFSLLAEKLVHFTVIVYENRDYIDTSSVSVDSYSQEAQVLTDEDVERRLARLTWLLFNVTNAQNSMKALGARDRKAAVSNNRQVLMWSLLEVVVIVFASVVQIIALTSAHRTRR